MRLALNSLVTVYVRFFECAERGFDDRWMKEICWLYCPMIRLMRRATVRTLF